MLWVNGLVGRVVVRVMIYVDESPPKEKSTSVCMCVCVCVTYSPYMTHALLQMEASC